MSLHIRGTGENDPAQYEEVTVGGTEFGFENIPEPNYHLFRSPSGEPGIMLFRKRR